MNWEFPFLTNQDMMELDGMNVISDYCEQVCNAQQLGNVSLKSHRP